MNIVFMATTGLSVVFGLLGNNIYYNILYNIIYCMIGKSATLSTGPRGGSAWLDTANDPLPQGFKSL